MPHATARSLRAYDRHGPLSVLANTTRLQAVRHSRLGLLAVNSFGRGDRSVAGLRLDGAASLLLRRDGREVTVAVSDPTMRRDSITLLLHGRRLRPVRTDDGVRVSPAPGGTLVRVRTRHAYGRSFAATLA